MIKQGQEHFNDKNLSAAYVNTHSKILPFLYIMFEIFHNKILGQN